MSAICAIMDEINTEHNMKSICRPAVAQWTERLTGKGQTRVRNWKGANILLSQFYRYSNCCAFAFTAAAGASRADLDSSVVECIPRVS